MANDKDKPANPNQPVDQPEPQRSPDGVPPSRPEPLDDTDPGEPQGPGKGGNP